MIIKCILIIAFWAISFSLLAQQDPQFSQNMHNHITVNPGFAGVRGTWVVSGIYRNQWQGMEGAPETYAFSVDAPLRIGYADGGVGLNLMSDRLGMQTHLHLMLNYAYKLKFSFGVMSVGAKIGIVNSKIEGEYHFVEGGDSNDPALNKEEVSKIMFDAGMGVFLSGDRYYAGVAVSHLTRPEMTVGETGRFFWTRHLFLTGGYAFHLSPQWKLQPSVFMKTDFISAQYSINSNFIYNERYWGGVSYRYEEAVSFMGGVELKNGLNVGYSYDWNTGNVGRHLGGSHEVTLSYSFGVGIVKKEKIYKSVRFL